MTKFIKNINFDVSNKNTFNSNNSNDVEILDFFDEDVHDDVILKGKYVDENGNSFPAEYYYDSYGSYNARYNDGNKDIYVKFNVDGSIESQSENL